MHLFWRILFIAVLFVSTDSVYLFLSRNYFQRQITDVQGSPIRLRLISAILCYIALVFGLWYFVLREKKSWKHAFILGLVIYSVYETTNYATLNKWRFQTVIMDTLWGGILFAITTQMVYFLLPTH
jgi:uncharacterized membrane protein